jgi:hypothetical protein
LGENKQSAKKSNDVGVLTEPNQDTLEANHMPVSPRGYIRGERKKPYRPVVTQLGSFCRFTEWWFISQTVVRTGRGLPVSNLLVGWHETPLESRHLMTNHFHKPCEFDCGGPTVPCAMLSEYPPSLQSTSHPASSTSTYNVCDLPVFDPANL